MSAEGGIYVVSGVNASVVVGRILATDPGAYVLSGADLTALVERLISTEPGVYTVTGLDAIIKLSDIIMSAEGGSYVIIGSATRALLEVDMIIGGSSPGDIAQAVWSHSDAQFLLSCIRNEKVLSKIGSVWYLIIYDGTGTVEILKKALKDKDGNDITDIAAGIMALELMSTV
jgi:hypothetical protein